MSAHSENIGAKKKNTYIANRCCWLWVVLLCFGSFEFSFESLTILVQPKGLNICFSQLGEN